MYCTGDPDREPVRCSEPSGYAHVGAEAAFAALTGLASGRPQRVDVSMQEVVFIANMATPARFPQTGFRGTRRGANIGRTREIWPTSDGFVSFGLRGGKARVPSLETLTKLVDTPALRAMDWSAFSPNTADDETLRTIEVDVAAFFAEHTMQELYDIACETNLMLAPINSPREILASAQLAARRLLRATRQLREVPCILRHHRVCRRPRGPIPAVGARAPARRRDAALPHRDRAEPARHPGVALPRGRVGRDEHPRVRFRRGRADRHPLLRRARRHRAAGGVEGAAGLPPRLRARAEEPPRSRGRADVRRVERRQAGRDVQPEAPSLPSSSSAGSSSSGPTRSRRTSRHAPCAASGSTMRRWPRTSPIS